MSFTFRPAVRENVSLLISLAGGTGSGKTFSAMELATGICGDKPFAVIDTEAGRAKHYADRFRFDHGDLRAPFSPTAYEAAILAADAAHYPVIVVDSGSHEHAGDGGILDMHEAEFARLGHRESCKMTAWIKPKMEHKRFVQKLLQIRAHLIFCLRAEEKVDIIKDASGKTMVVPKQSAVGLDGWVPICEKTLPFEMTASFLLLATRPGFGLPIKLQEQHRTIFPLDRPIDRKCGEAIARWAAGGAKPTQQAEPTREATPSTGLDEVISGIAMAESMAELDAVKEYAAKLPGAEKAQAREVYLKRKAEILSHNEPLPTDERQPGDDAP